MPRLAVCTVGVAAARRGWRLRCRGGRFGAGRGARPGGGAWSANAIPACAVVSGPCARHVGLGARTLLHEAPAIKGQRKGAREAPEGGGVLTRRSFCHSPRCDRKGSDDTRLLPGRSSQRQRVQHHARRRNDRHRPGPIRYGFCPSSPKLWPDWFLRNTPGTP